MQLPCRICLHSLSLTFSCMLCGDKQFIYSYDGGSVSLFRRGRCRAICIIIFESGFQNKNLLNVMLNIFNSYLNIFHAPFCSAQSAKTKLQTVYLSYLRTVPISFIIAQFEGGFDFTLSFALKLNENNNLKKQFLPFCKQSWFQCHTSEGLLQT